MEENKNLQPEIKEKKFKIKKEKAPKRHKKIKNQALLKRGGYAIAITAAVLVGVVILNVLLGVLADRINLDFDMSLTSQNTIDEKNVEFIKSVKKDVLIQVCADEKLYAEGEMYQYAYYYYGIQEDYTDYYKQTINLMNKYNSYNKNIKIDYIDTQGAEFSKITSSYPNDSIKYGDIIVTCEENGNKRHKIVSYEDIYTLTQDDSAASYGYSSYIVEGNNIETALTSAISYVTSSQIKKAAFLTGHSKNDFTADFRKLLETNNYEVEVVSATMITNISDEYDALFIVAPTTDFLDTELDAIADFLDNDGKYNKGLVFFGDATAPYLPNLYSYLEQWGISVGEGVLFETNSNNHMPDEPTTLGSYASSASEDKILSDIGTCITDYNLPFEALFDIEGQYTVEALIETPETVVAAPVGSTSSWSGTDSYKKSSYPTVIQSERMTYDAENNEIKNYVVAFSSVGFIYSDYAEMSQLSNKNIAFAVAERAVGAESAGIEFVSKTIENETFIDSVTQSSVNIIMIIFVIMIPLALLATSIYVYIRRKNS